MLIRKPGNKTLTAILLILIFASMIQITIIWGEDIKGFPFGLFSRGEDSSGGQLTLGSLFVPSSIYIGKGIEQPRYKLKEGSFETIWNDTGRYLVQIFKNENISGRRSYPYSLDEWKKIVTRKGYYVTFPFDIEPDILRCLLGCSIDLSNITGGIRAMAVLPWESVNPGILNIYIRTAYEIYRFSLETADLNERKLIYDIIIKESESSRAVQYHYLVESLPTSAFSFEINGTLLITDDESTKEKDIAIGTRNSLDLQSSVNDDSYLNETAVKISNGNDTNYITTKSADGTVTLKNINNVYRYYKEGVLEYAFISGISSRPELNYGTMLSNITEQINSFALYINTDAIFLSGARKEKDLFVFTFDYICNGKPVAVDMPYADTRASNLIEITANGSDVISFRLVPIQTFNVYEGIESRLDFVSLLDRLYLAISQYPEFSMKFYESVYLVRSINNVGYLSPVWRIISFSNERYFVDKTVD